MASFSDTTLLPTPKRPALRPGRHSHRVENESNYYDSVRDLTRWYGSVIPTIFVPTCLVTAWAAPWAYLYTQFPDSWFRAIVPDSFLLITILSVVMGLLLVFRNNAAYDRFWEGRRLFGNLEREVRNMSRFIWIVCKANNAHEDMEKRGAMNLLIALMHSIKHHLRNELGVAYSDVLPYLSHLPEFAPDAPWNRDLDVHNVPLEITYHIAGFAMKARSNNQLDVPQMNVFLASLNSMTESFTGFERIRGTPMPVAYGVHLKQTLVIYLLSLPFQLLTHHGWGTILVQFVTSFTLLGLEAIGGEIENPFGLDPNDLPIEDICDQIHVEVTSLMDRPSRVDSKDWGT
ncbi:hypothetical protein HKX48_003127, partial [Thoreauomyces humboldtii]